MWRDYEILEQYAKNACAPNIDELFSETIKMVNASDEEKQKFLQSKMMQMKGNFYRGDGYIHQLVDIAACFDAQYQEDIANIASFQSTYISEIDSVVSILEANISAAMPGCDLTEYQTKIQLLTDAITINKQRIEAKIKEPTSIASLEDTDSLLIEIGTIIDGFNKKIKANNDIVGDLKTKKVKCKQEVWEYLANY